MRILMVSKFRTFTGGAEAHISALSRELEWQGHEVESFTSEDLPDSARAFSAAANGVSGRSRAATQLLWNREAEKLLAQKIESWRPDVVHFHSIYHQLSPSVLEAPGNIATVMTLHDYKLAAPCYSLFRDGDVCDLCVGRTISTSAVRHRCVKGSTVASLVCVGEELLHRRRYINTVRKFIVPSDYSAEIMSRAGVPREQLCVVNWGVDAFPASREAPYDLPGNDGVKFLYAGRLHANKGIDLLLNAWEEKTTEKPANLFVAGDGDMQDRVIDAARANKSIDYLGLVDRSSMGALMRAVDVVVVPSLVPETFGLSAVEALRAGAPVLASSRGALTELRGPGVLPIAELTVASLADSLSALVESPALIQGARRDLADRDMSAYSTARMTKAVLDVYASAGASGS